MTMKRMSMRVVAVAAIMAAFGLFAEDEVSLFDKSWTSTENYFGNESFAIPIDNPFGTITLRLDVASVKSHKNVYLVINGKNVLAGNASTSNLEIGGVATAITPQYGWTCYATVTINPATGRAAVHWSTHSGGNQADGVVELGPVHGQLTVSVPEFPDWLAMCFDRLVVTQTPNSEQVLTDTATLAERTWDSTVNYLGGDTFTAKLVSKVNPITINLDVANFRSNLSTYLTVNGKELLGGNSSCHVVVCGEDTGIKADWWEGYGRVTIDPATGEAEVLWSTRSGLSKATRTVSLGEIGDALEVAIPPLVDTFALNLNSFTVTQDYHTKPKRQELSSPKLTFAIGDSITQGYKAGGRENSWAKIVADGLNTVCLNDALSGTMVSEWFPVLTGRPGLNGETNAEINGLDASSFTNRIRAAEVIVFSLGFNDFNREHNLGSEVAGEIEEFVAAIHTANPAAKIVMMGMGDLYCLSKDVHEGFNPKYSYPELVPYVMNCNARLVRTLNSHPYREYCVYVDCTDDFSKENCYTPCSDGAPDGLHPGYVGASNIAARVLDVAFGKTLPSKPPVVHTLRDIPCTPDTNYFGGDTYKCRLATTDGWIMLDLAGNTRHNWSAYLRLNGVQILSGTPSEIDAECYTLIGSDLIAGFSSKWKPFTANILVNPATGRTIVTWKNGEYNVGKRELDIGPVEKKLLVEVPPFVENKPMWFNSFTVKQWNGKNLPNSLQLIVR